MSELHVHMWHGVFLRVCLASIFPIFIALISFLKLAFTPKKSNPKIWGTMRECQHTLHMIVWIYDESTLCFLPLNGRQNRGEDCVRIIGFFEGWEHCSIAALCQWQLLVEHTQGRMWIFCFGVCGYYYCFVLKCFPTLTHGKKCFFQNIVISLFTRNAFSPKYFHESGSDTVACRACKIA